VPPKYLQPDKKNLRLGRESPAERQGGVRESPRESRCPVAADDFKENVEKAEIARIALDVVHFNANDDNVAQEDPKHVHCEHFFRLQPQRVSLCAKRRVRVILETRRSE